MINDVPRDISCLRMKVQIENEFIYIINRSVEPHLNLVFDLKINNSENFLINRKVISLHMETKYVKRSKNSFDGFSAKQTPRATLSLRVDNLYTYLRFLIYQHIYIRGR